MFGLSPIRYREPVFRPPVEADSLIFQVAYGCPHNRCRFCGMYKGVRYAVRSREEVLAEIAAAGRCHPETLRVFLADGDVMALSYERLGEILVALNAAFPRLTRVNLYANGSSILAKSPAALREFRSLKLNTLYMGLESGDEDLLRAVDKGETAAAMVEAGRRAQECGLRLSVMVLLGLGGKDGSARHAAATAATLNAMQPKLLSALRYIEVPGARPWPGHVAVSEREAVGELRSLLAALTLRRTVFTANHASNPVPLKGSLPRDRERLLAEIDAILATNGLDATGPGRLPLWL
jgi:radical SAM superfamily enzyme YgiQ (UPF0313 family)